MIYHPDSKMLNTLFIVRRGWRGDNHNPCIEEKQTTQWSKENLSNYVMATENRIFINMRNPLNILDKYIARVVWMNDDPSLMSISGDVVAPFMYDASLSLYLDLPGRANSTFSVLCSYLAGLRWTNSWSCCLIHYGQRLSNSINHPL